MIYKVYVQFCCLTFKSELELKMSFLVVIISEHSFETELSQCLEVGVSEYFWKNKQKKTTAEFWDAGETQSLNIGQRWTATFKSHLCF